MTFDSRTEIRNASESSNDKIKNRRFSLKNLAWISSIYACGSGLVYYMLSRNNASKSSIPPLDNPVRTINGVKLDNSDQDWIRKNVILFKQKAFLCWHNVFMQFLACPEIRKRNYDSPKIMGMIKWITEKLNDKNRDDCFRSGVDVPDEVRQAQDGYDPVLKDYYDELLKNGKFGNLRFISANAKFDNKDFDDIIGLIHFGANSNFLWYNIKEPELEIYEGKEIKEKMYHYLNNKNKKFRYFANHIYEQIKYRMNNNKLNNNKHTKIVVRFFDTNFDDIRLLVDRGSSDSKLTDQSLWNKVDPKKPTGISFLNDLKIYPTFITHSVNHNHFVAYYVVYNKDKSIKYFLLANGQNKGITPMSKDEGLKELKKHFSSEEAYVFYSTKEVVEEFYTP